MNDEDASYVANLTVQARPDHRWELDIAEGYDFEVIPGETLSFALQQKISEMQKITLRLFHNLSMKET